MSPLALLNEGEIAEIIEHHPGHDRAHTHHHEHGPCCGQCLHCPCRAAEGGTPPENNDRLQKMGLRPGKYVEMVTNGGTGSIVLPVDESRIALPAWSVAFAIYQAGKIMSLPAADQKTKEIMKNMNYADGFLAAAILAGAVWLLYRSMAKKGSCSGCSGCSCGKKEDKGKDRPVRLS